MNHAFFKALLFLSAGAVIHALGDEQDMRRMGGVVQVLPFTYAMMVIGSLALIGFPFLTGFYSKDAILECAYATYTVSGTCAYWLGSISALFTSYYSFRLLIFTFLGRTNTLKASLLHIHDAPFVMALPLMLLAIGSIFGGYMAREMFLGLGTDFWAGAIVTLPSHSVQLESEYIPQAIKMIPLFSGCLGAFVAFTFNDVDSPARRFAYENKTSPYGRFMYLFLNRRWLVDKVYNDLLARPALTFGYEVSFRTVDKGILELLGPIGVAQFFQNGSSYLKGLHSGLVYHAALMMLLGLTGLLTLSLVPGGFGDARLLVVLVGSFFFYQSKTQHSLTLSH